MQESNTTNVSKSLSLGKRFNLLPEERVDAIANILALAVTRQRTRIAEDNTKKQKDARSSKMSQKRLALSPKESVSVQSSNAHKQSL